MNRRLAINNGGVGDEQLRWLQHELEGAHAVGEAAIVFGHTPVLPGVTNDLDGLAWDFEAVLGVLRSAAGRACCVAYVAGHDHRGGYCRDGPGGTHHVTPLAMKRPIRWHAAEVRCRPSPALATEP